MANTLNLDGIKNYIAQNQEIIASQIVAMTPSVGFLQVQNGVKSDTALHQLVTNLEIQDGKACGFNAAGSQTVSDRKFEPALLKVNTEYCAKDFVGTYKAYELKIAMGKSPLPLEEALINDILQGIANENERLIWSGDKSEGDLVDGFIKIMADANIGTITTNAEGVYEKVKVAYKEIKDRKASIVMSTPMYKQLILDLMEKNLYHYNETENAEQVITLPGTNLKIYGIDGMEDAENMYVVRLDEMFVGMDNAEDASTFDFFFSEDDRVYKLIVEWMLGVQILNPAHFKKVV